MEEKELEIAKCSVCHKPFEREVNREEGKLISCPAHSFGEVEPQETTLTP